MKISREHAVIQGETEGTEKEPLAEITFVSPFGGTPSGGPTYWLKSGIKALKTLCFLRFLLFTSRSLRLRNVAVIIIVTLLAVGAQADQYDTLRLSWQSNLVNNGSSLSSVANTANAYWSSMATSSSRTYLWSDLPFGSDSANITTTYKRLQAMALAWATPGCSLQNNASLAAAVASGLDWMNANVYTSAATEYNNWYDWEIGAPQALNNTAVLLYPALTSAEISNYNNAVDHFSPDGSGPTYGWMTGANTSDKVLVDVIRGILGKNAGKINEGQTNLSPVFLYVSSGDGFHTDGSFVFHSDIAYNGHYGLVLLGDIPKLVNLLMGSAWQITDSNLTNVYNWVSNSFEPLVYNGAMMDMVRGRAISWSYETEYDDGASVVSAVRAITQFAPATVAASLNSWANSPKVASGQFHFGSMDRVVALRNGFGFGLSMSSSRIANYESINGGNLHGWFTGDGMTYLYLGQSDTQFDGDFWPTVDPYHLPGTTIEIVSHANGAGEATKTSQNWVGGAQVANTYGVAGMSLAAWNTTLVAKKSWVMLDNEIVCLGAGVTCGGPSEVDTVVENRRLGTSPTNNFWLNGVKIPPVMGWSSNIPSASWCALDGVGGYYFPGGATNLYASFTANTGSWSQINSIDSTTSYTDDYLELWFNSGIKPTNATYAYVMLPNMTEAAVSNYAANPDIIILTNTSTVQAVRKPALGVVAANFWTNGAGSADLISVNNASSVITWETSTGISVGVSDPTQVNTGSITVTLNRAATGLLSADLGVTVVQLSPQIVFSANVNGSLGKSFQAAFSYSGPGVPVITSVYPNGTNLFQSTNTLAFNVSSAAGIAATNILVTLNGVPATNLTFNGSPTSWKVLYPYLQPSKTYKLMISAKDANGNVSSITNSFDTFSPYYAWEAEDYDYTGGQFMDNPPTDAYAGIAAAVNVDTHQVNFAGADLYRPNGMDTEVNGDIPRLQYVGTGFKDYSIGYFSAGSWVNYTRHYPAGTYNVYARLASGGAATTCTLSQVTHGWGTTNQTANFLGTFNVPLTAWESYNYIPLEDNYGNLVTVAFNGSTNTVELGRSSGATSDCNANFLMLVPVFSMSAFRSGSNLAVSFPTQSGFNYQVQYTTNLINGSWTTVGGNIAGNNATQTLHDSLNGGPVRYYRVQAH